MATTERDYYELLGIGKDASEAEVKKAFRGLARELHPDVSEEPDAEARFKEVVEAYEVLSKSETRELYDRYGHAGLRSGGFQPGHFDFGSLSDLFSAFFGDDLFAGAGRRGARGSDVAAEVEIDLEEAARGATRGVPFRVAVVCSRCSGNGAEPGSAGLDVPDLRRPGPAPAGVTERLRRVRPHPDVPPLLRRRTGGRASLRGLRRLRPGRRGALARRADPGRDPRRAADPDLW